MPDRPDRSSQEESLRDGLTRVSTVVDFMKRDVEELRDRLRSEFVSTRDGERMREETAKLDRALAGFDARVAATISKFESQMWQQLDGFKRDHVSLVVHNAVVERLKNAEEEIKAFEGKYVTKTEHGPVKHIAFGAVFVIVTAVLGALVALVVRGGTP